MCMEAWFCSGCVYCVCVCVCVAIYESLCFMVGPARYSGAGIRLQPREHAFSSSVFICLVRGKDSLRHGWCIVV